MRTFSIKRTILFLMLSIALFSCGNKKEKETEEENLPEDVVELRDDQIKLAKIETGKIEMRSLGGEVKTNGVISVAPQSLATVCMPMGGFIKSTTLMPGNAVSKGQVLAIIENQEFIDMQQNYLETKNKLEYATAEYNRHGELFKDDVYSQKNLQQVTTEYRNLKAELKAMEEKLSLIGINPLTLNESNLHRSVALKAPISGYLKAVNVTIGKSVSASDVLFEIVNTDKLLLQLTLFEKDAGIVANGQKIKFSLNNEQESHEAIIYQVGKSVNNDKTYTVYARISSRCTNMLPGMYVNAMIETANRTVTSLPAEAVVTFDDKDYIFVFGQNKIENGHRMTEYRMVEVTKGVSRNGFVEVILPSDFQINKEKVIVKGAYNLLSAKKNAGEMSC